MKRFLFITIDTEEDVWGGYTVKNPSLENIKNIYLVQKIFEKYNAIPTYLINYPVAIDDYSVKLFSYLFDNNKCDIGTHCHPWNTPPYFNGGDLEYNSLMRNLPEELIEKKMIQLHSKIVDNFNLTPTVFRAGRWGVGDNVIRVIKKLSYSIDTSLIPNIDMENCIGSEIYIKSILPKGMYEGNRVCHKVGKCNDCSEKNICIVELPVTVGFLQKNFRLCYSLRTYLMREFPKQFRLIGMLDCLRLLNFRTLEPEISSLEDMVKLSKVVMNNGHKFLNMSFHSTSLLPGKSPFVKNGKDLELFLDKIDKYLNFISLENVKCIGMSRSMEVLS